MAETAFTQGRYHQLFDAEIAQSPFGYDAFHHQSFLNENYHFAFDLIEQRGWQNPLSHDNPQVLLMGTASYLTARAFVDFVKRQNNGAQIVIADLSSYPLERCSENGLDQERNVRLRQADIRTLLETFPPNSFEQIETDGLLQFLSPEDKKLALAQVFAALKPGGVFTTRDRFISQTADEKTDREYRNWQNALGRRMAVQPYYATKESMWDLLGETGFSRSMVRRDHHRSLKFFNNIVARKPLR